MENSHDPKQVRLAAEDLICSVRDRNPYPEHAFVRGEIIEIEATYLEVRLYFKGIPGFARVKVGERLPGIAKRN